MANRDPNRVLIFDTTLRDGEQSPGCSMTQPEKLRLARALAELGVDVIEAGFPVASPGDWEAVHEIAREVRGPIIAGLARCNREDIDKAWSAVKVAARPRIHVFLATSAIHREYKLNMAKDEIIRSAVEGVKIAREFCDDIEFSPEDASRTEPEFLREVVEAVIEAGATTINVPDTVGYTVPEEFHEVFAYLQKNVRGADQVTFSVHCHNDLGLAVANSLAAVRGGARQVECTINGIGERAGNAALEELVMALKVRRHYFNAQTRIDTRRLVPTSRLLSRITGMSVQRNKAIVGQNAFAHESGIHQHGMLRHRGTYEIMHPEDVGWAQSQIVLGRHSGRAALADRLQSMGFGVDEAQLNAVFAAFKTLAEKKCEVFDADLEALLLDADARTPSGYRLLRLHVSTGVADDSLPTASVQLLAADGERISEAAVGDGPVHALFAALSRATGMVLDIEHYHVSSVTTGDDAQGQASVTARVAGREFTGSGTSPDILDASALAWLDIANRALRASLPIPTPAAKRAAITA